MEKRLLKREVFINILAGVHDDVAGIELKSST